MASLLSLILNSIIQILSKPFRNPSILHGLILVTAPNLTVTAPDRCYCLNQASLTIRTKGRAGEFPVGETNRSQTATDVVMVIT